MRGHAPVKRIFYIFMALLISSICFRAQDASNSIGLKAGTPYTADSIDHIDLSTGNVVGKIPLISYPQRGNLPPLTFSLDFNTSPWYIEVTCDPYGDSCMATYEIQEGKYNSIPYLGAFVRSNLMDIEAGFNVEYNQIICGTSNWPYIDEGGCGAGTYVRKTAVIIDETGTSHSLLYDESNPSWARAIDGSGYSLYQQNGYNNYLSVGEDSFVAYTPTGNTLIHSTTGTLTIRDASGNSISAKSPGYTDSVGRFITSPYNLIWGSSTSSADLTKCPNLADSTQPALGAVEWDVPGVNGGQEAYILCLVGGYSQPIFYYDGAIGSSTCDADYSELQNMPDESGSTWSFPLSAWSNSYYITTWCNETLSIGGIQSVVLPNGTAWSFLYDMGTPYIGSDGNTYYTESYGTIKKIFMPGGGTISYTYANRYGKSDDWISNVNSRVVTSRTETDAYGNSSTKNYTYTNPSNGVMTTTETTYDRTTVHTFNGSFAISNTQPILETKSQTYQGQGVTTGTPLEEVDNTYNATVTYNTVAGAGGVSPLLPVDVVTKKDGVVVSEVKKSYGSPFVVAAYDCSSQTECSAGRDTGSANDRYVSIWGPLSVYLDQVTEEDVYDGSGNLLRKTTTTPEYTQNSAVYSANQLHLVGAETVQDGSGNTLSSTTYKYDESGYICSGTSGNQTSVSHWLNTTGSSLTTHTTYDCHNMPTAITDASGNTTTTTYDSTGLFPSAVQHPSTNGVPHIDYYTYDANIGKVLSHTDQNGSSAGDSAHTTTYTYDTTGRITKVVYPPVSSGTPETDFCYTDSGGSICSSGSAPYSVYTANLISSGQYESPSITTYDGLGRVYETVSPSNAIVQTRYDQDGRVYSVTNPYLSSSDSTYGSTIYTYDAIGRKLQQLQPDKSKATWAYSGNTAVSTDEKGNQWCRTSDALGRLITVLEPSSTSKTPSMQTDYSYDALGNLKTVTQWGGASGSSGAVTRSFKYDSLSRLISSTNPEAGTTTYTYDANSNLIAKMRRLQTARQAARAVPLAIAMTH